MRRWRNLAVAVGLLGAVVACGDDSPDVSPGDVTVRLLTAAELGSGWQQGHEVGDADYQDSWQIPCDDAAINPVVVEVLRPSDGRQFEATDGSRRHLIELVTTGDDDELATALDAYLGVVRSCQDESTWGGVSVSVTPLDLGDVGDQGGAFRSIATLTAGATNAVWHVRNASVRVGGHIISVGLTEILDSADPRPVVSDVEFVETVRTAVGGVTPLHR